MEVVSDPVVVVVAAAASTPDEEIGTNVKEECTCEDEVWDMLVEPLEAIGTKVSVDCSRGKDA